MWYKQDSKRKEVDLPRLLIYLVDLELEVDRLRRHGQLVHSEVRQALSVIQQLCMEMMPADSPPPALAKMGKAIEELTETLGHLRDLPGYHPAHDQVIAVAVRPLTEQVFRWQQRLQDAPDVALQFELESEHIEWFPGRLRHILDNLIANSLKYCDPEKDESWVKLGLRISPDAYKFRVTDNGLGMEPSKRKQILELFYRAAPVREAGMGVGLAAVKLLVEQSGGTVTVDSKAGQGTSIVVVLPRYQIDDFLT